ncbi:MAG TPA: DUF1080 domain-containing protein [Bacteroidetes bacterium]|nr:DUF1080 domain-containing protein [Bacteroidota bacterium]
MKNKIFFIVFVFSLSGMLILNDCVHKKQEKKAEQSVSSDEVVTKKTEAYNVLTPEEKKEGWELLFNGKNLDGWRGFRMDTVPDNWTVEDNCLVCLGKGSDKSGDIITSREFENFDLKLEWKISPAGNSGIFYHVVEDHYPTPYATGPEYQLIDDLGWPGKLNDWQTTGANYAMDPPVNAKIKPALTWNSAEIVVNGPHVIHYLNGSKVVEYDLWTDEWKAKVKNCKWKDYPGYGLAHKGHIGLQDHGSKIWFRNIRIKVFN